ncbi:hypothetical protein THRCLA_02169, partial [Thraustotheca clavata]
DAADCLNMCQQRAVRERENFCGPYRNKIPRPTLFARCGEAYNDATRVGCNLCYEPNLYKSFRDNIFHYCDKWARGYPHAYAATCTEAYIHAVNDIDEFLVVNEYISAANAQADAIADAVDDEPQVVDTHYDSTIESAESIVERHLREARREAREDYLQDRFDRHL